MTNRIKARFVGGEMTITEGVGDDSIETMTRYIADVGRRARNLLPIFQEWSQVLFEQEADIFEAEGIPRWPDLAPAYRDWKRRHYGEQPILQRTGRLKRSLTGHTGDTILRMGPRSLHFGTKVPYSVPLQEGNFAGAQGPRPHVYMSAENFQRMSQDALEYIANGGGTSPAGNLAMGRRR